jgi:hypothetical protein
VERVNEKYGWVVFLFLGLLWLVVGLTEIFSVEALAEEEIFRLTGMSYSELYTSNPQAYAIIHWLYGSLGLLKTSWSFFLLAVTLTGYRRGEKWAWYTLWLAPILLVSQGIFNSVFLGDFNEMIRWIPVTTISLLGLLLPIRKFFPRKPPSDQLNI